MQLSVDLRDREAVGEVKEKLLDPSKIGGAEVCVSRGDGSEIMIHDVRSHGNWAT